MGRAHLDKENPDLTLAALSPDNQFREFEFVFPIMDRIDVKDASIFSQHLAKVIRARGGLKGDDDYLEQLSALDFKVIRGYLKGFIDLVFVHQQRWYIVDYKSNYLGDDKSDYNHLNLQHAMAKHHYYLQYLLYAVALHRYLTYRMADYQYHTHFGKVYYLFLRGMSPQYEAGHGVFQDRPSLELIEALSALFEKGGA
jgi:exodeoxyribonuclease V beta subunit